MCTNCLSRSGKGVLNWMDGIFCKIPSKVTKWVKKNCLTLKVDAVRNKYTVALQNELLKLEKEKEKCDARSSKLAERIEKLEALLAQPPDVLKSDKTVKKLRRAANAVESATNSVLRHRTSSSVPSDSDDDSDMDVKDSGDDSDDDVDTVSSSTKVSLADAQLNELARKIKTEVENAKRGGSFGNTACADWLDPTKRPGLVARAISNAASQMYIQNLNTATRNAAIEKLEHNMKVEIKAALGLR